MGKSPHRQPRDAKARSVNIPRFSDPNMQAYVRDMARGRPGAAPERQAGGLVWYPTINSERFPCDRAPFPNQTQAKDAARDFKAKCNDELGEPER